MTSASSAEGLGDVASACCSRVATGFRIGALSHSSSEAGSGDWDLLIWSISQMPKVSSGSRSRVVRDFAKVCATPKKGALTGCNDFGSGRLAPAATSTSWIAREVFAHMSQQWSIKQPYPHSKKPF